MAPHAKLVTVTPFRRFFSFRVSCISCAAAWPPRLLLSLVSLLLISLTFLSDGIPQLDRTGCHCQRLFFAGSNSLAIVNANRLCALQDCSGMLLW
jgi:hypothetical protein